MRKYKKGDRFVWRGFEDDPHAVGRITRKKRGGAYEMEWEDDGSKDIVYDDDELIILTDEEITNSLIINEDKSFGDSESAMEYLFGQE